MYGNLYYGSRTKKQIDIHFLALCDVGTFFTYYCLKDYIP